MRAFWPRKAPEPPRLRLSRKFSLPTAGFWDWISHGVAKRPLVIWSISVIVLMPLVLIGLRTHAAYRATGELCPSAESLRGLEAIQRHFTAGEVGPVTVLLVSDTPWDSAEGRLQIDHLSRGLKRMENVARVRSLTQPIGIRLPVFVADPTGKGWLNYLLMTVQPTILDFHENMIALAKPHYVSQFPAESGGRVQYVTRLDVILQSDPFDPASVATLRL